MSEPEIKQLPDPIDWTELFQSRFLHAADLKGRDVVLTITAVKLEELPDDKRPGEMKVMGSLFFEGKKKALGINRTNAACLKEMFGTKVAAWKGKRVGLYPTTTRMPKKSGGGMEEVDCIRIRGSPDIPADLSFVLTLPKKKPQTVKLVRLVPKGAQAAPETKPSAPHESKPESDPFA